jgi:hypothetical protein
MGLREDSHHREIRPLRHFPNKRMLVAARRRGLAQRGKDRAYDLRESYVGAGRALAATMLASLIMRVCRRTESIG